MGAPRLQVGQDTGQRGGPRARAGEIRGDILGSAMPNTPTCSRAGDLAPGQRCATHASRGATRGPRAAAAERCGDCERGSPQHRKWTGSPLLGGILLPGLKPSFLGTGEEDGPGAGDDGRRRGGVYFRKRDCQAQARVPGQGWRPSPWAPRCWAAKASPRRSACRLCCWLPVPRVAVGGFQGRWVVSVSLFGVLPTNQQTKTVSCLLKSLAQISVYEWPPSIPAATPCSTAVVRCWASSQSRLLPTLAMECHLRIRGGLARKEARCNVSHLQACG